MSTVINVKIVMSSFTYFLNTKSLKSRACFMSEFTHGLWLPYWTVCGSRRKGECEKKKDGTAPGASEGLA